MYGNLAGNPKTALTGDTLLTTADSALAPCTGDPLTDPRVIRDGSIRFALCSKGGPSGDANLQEATLLSLAVDGTPAPITLKAAGGGTTPGSSGTPTGGGTPGSSSTPTGGGTGGASPQAATKAAGSGPSLLAFTGSDISMAFWAGILALLLGLILTVVDRRRRRAAPDAQAPPT